MDILELIFRRLLLALGMLAVVVLVNITSDNNLWLTGAAVALLVMPVVVWFGRPHELRQDSFGKSLWYSLYPTVAGFVTWLVFNISSAEVGPLSAGALVATVMLAHIVHVLLRIKWARAGKQPAWAQWLNIIVLSAGEVLAGLLSSVGKGSGESDWSSSSGSQPASNEMCYVNPTTGLPMAGNSPGGVDVGGNMWGEIPFTPHHNDTSSF